MNNAINVNPISFPYNFGPLTPPALPGKGLYEVGTEQLFALGTICTTWDGREFRYAKSAGICYAGQGCEFVQTPPGLAGSALSVGQIIGDSQITMVCASHDAIAKDALRGGYVGIHNATNADAQFRGILGNPASAANAVITLYLDGVLTAVVTVSTTTELFQNPYGALQLGANVNYPKAGVPATYVSAANLYFWVQTKGWTWVAPQVDKLTDNDIGCSWRHDGTLDNNTDAAAASGFISSQYAGYRAIGTGPLVGPLFMLQG